MFRQKSIFCRLLCSLLAFAVAWCSGSSDLLKVREAVAADFAIPNPGTMVKLSDKGSLPLIQGIKFDPANPFDLQFILERNGKSTISQEEKAKLIRYFFAGLTIADEDLWVNLSPYENDRIIDNNVNQTELAQTLLAQDYLLKQLSSSITHPDTELGAKYWQDNNFGETFNKIWISPSALSVYDAEDTILISDIELNVQTEADYLAAKSNSQISSTSNAVKEHVVPAIKKDVNSGSNFAPLRQMINSLALAQLFKKKFSNSLYSFYYDAGLIKGIDKGDPSTKDIVFNKYVEAFDKGAYNTVKKVRNENGTLIKKNYFSGGMSSSIDASVVTSVSRADLIAFDKRQKELVTINTKFQAAEDYSYKQVATASSSVEQFEARVDALTSDIDSLANQTTSKELAEQLKVLSSSIEEITSELSTEVDATYLNRTMDLAKNFAKDPTLSSSLVSELETIYKKATGTNIAIKAMSLFMFATLGFVSVDRLAKSVYAPMPDGNDIFYATIMSKAFLFFNFFASLGKDALKQSVSSKTNYLYDDLLNNKVKSMEHLYQTLFLSTNFYNYDFDKTISALKQIDNFDGERIEKNSQDKLEIENIIFDLENNKVNQEYWKKTLGKDTYKKLKKLKSNMLSYQEATSSSFFDKTLSKYLNRSIALGAIAAVTIVTAYFVNDKELTAEEINQKIEFFNESLETKNTELQRQKIIFDRIQKERDNLQDSIDTYQKMLKDEHGIDVDTSAVIEETLEKLSSSIYENNPDIDENGNVDMMPFFMFFNSVLVSLSLALVSGILLTAAVMDSESEKDQKPEKVNEITFEQEQLDTLKKELQDSLDLDAETSAIIEEAIQKLSSGVGDDNSDQIIGDLFGKPKGVGIYNVVMLLSITALLLNALVVPSKSAELNTEPTEVIQDSIDLFQEKINEFQDSIDLYQEKIDSINTDSSKATNGGINLDGLTDGVEIAESSAVITLSAKEIENIAGLTFEFVGPSKVLPLSQILTPVMPK